MKKLSFMLFMAMTMTLSALSVNAQPASQTTTQTTTQTTPRERLSREQLAEKQAAHIASQLAFDDKTTARFTDTYIQCQKEIWALGPRHKRVDNATEEQAEQAIKQRFEKSEKLLDIRQKYYKKYSEFLTQTQIQRVYQLERQMMKRQMMHHKGPKGPRGKHPQLK